MICPARTGQIITTISPARCWPRVPMAVIPPICRRAQTPRQSLGCAWLTPSWTRCWLVASCRSGGSPRASWVRIRIRRRLAGCGRNPSGRPRCAGDAAADQAASRAAEVRLDRRPVFRPLGWPPGPATRGGTGPDLLQRKQSPDGGWAAEAAYHREPARSGPVTTSNRDVRSGRMNERVTAGALGHACRLGRL